MRPHLKERAAIGFTNLTLHANVVTHSGRARAPLYGKPLAAMIAAMFVTMHTGEHAAQAK